jgi:hypothetical protein
VPSEVVREVQIIQTLAPTNVNTSSSRWPSATYQLNYVYDVLSLLATKCEQHAAAVGLQTCPSKQPRERTRSLRRILQRNAHCVE